jgi:hypothetical protein
MAYNSPGVYVEEISKLPPSVAEVSTAIPAFIGYTKTGSSGDGPVVARINTLLEYVELFGGPKLAGFAITTDAEGKVTGVTRSVPDHELLMFYAVSHYFKNGGGSCYIVSVGADTATPTKAAFVKGLELLAKEDEPTLIVLTDAVGLDPADYHDLCQESLKQCQKLGDRFAIFDVKGGDVGAFRENVGMNYLKYGAAYHPYLQTSLSYEYEDKDVTITPAPPGDAFTLASIQSTNTALYNQVKARLTSERVVLPPSAAVAGIYASVDRDRGVWKAPANVSVSAVIGPMTKITHEDQDGLNIDPTGGKSINAIRAFTGKGTLVWGARTLAGNDNEWRYVSVRRLFIMIEESARKATAFAVFEPNDMTTWLKVKGMIESYLYGLWERGALAGPSPAAAYFVNVGLGKTMTTQDILEGRMNIEIGIAAVRPAEFIILRFSHKLQQA